MNIPLVVYLNSFNEPFNQFCSQYVILCQCFCILFHCTVFGKLVVQRVHRFFKYFNLTRQSIETVVLLSKLKVDHHIEIELKMDELDLTAAESKATYDEIKAYVLNKYGLKVSQLYIAQIKRKCGIIERKNYNVSKKEDAKVPQCPPEKEAAIMDALKHFQMI